MGIGTAELAIIMVFSIPLVAIIGGLFISMLKILKGGSGKDGRLNAEESQMIQELFHIASRLEKRVDVLETLIMENRENR